MRIIPIISPGCAAAFFAVLAVCFAQTLEEWLADEYAPILSSTHLERYVPVPLNKETAYAFDRFSFLEGISRIIKGNKPVHHVREQTISEERVLELTDDHYKLGMVYFWGLGGIKRNLSLAFDHFLYAANNDTDADAMFMVGLAYSTGLLGDQGPEENQAKATLYYTMAAEYGSMSALLALGHRKRFGIHSIVDLEAAREYYQQAGHVMLAALEEYHELGQPWYYNRVNKRTFVFGAELNTGLYGRHAYRKHISRGVDPDISLGSYSAAWRLISSAYPKEFVDLDDALETLYYRSEEEYDAAAMYALARIHAVGIDSGPEWKEALYYARKCLQQSFVPNKRIMLPVHQNKIESLCAEFLAERYLHGDEGVAQNVTQARRLYAFAEKKAKSEYAHQQCNSCASGIVLCDLQEAELNGTLPEVVSFANETFREQFMPAMISAFSTSKVTTDYTLAIYLAKMQIESGSLSSARRTLRKTIADTGGLAPVASLLLAEFESGDQQLHRYIQAVKALEEMFMPLEFAHLRYAAGDLESGILGFMISSELGSQSASINLADLLDVRHSMLGSKYGSRWWVLRCFSEWPLPDFVKNRVELAARYFAVAALHGSVDALSKVVEYGWAYGIIPEKLNQWYLETLIAYNFGMAQWFYGTLEYSRENFGGAMDRYKRALVCPEAWLPVKFSQFATSLKLIADGSSGRSIWWRLKDAYKAMSAFEPEFSPDSVMPFLRESNLTSEKPAMTIWDTEAVADVERSNPLLTEIFSTTVVAITILILGAAAARLWIQRPNRRNPL